ncbi:MAG TPA: hypothetical protein VH853_02255 [Polyangia bacterium]|jgi:hypothetical protein|nr:hypothetical protein [Polyangia bacterium]
MRGTSFIAVGVVVVVSAAASRAFARKPMSEEAQRRVLLEQLAAASAEIAPQERTDGDLMYAAMRQWRGEPRGSAAVDKALAQSKSDIRHDRKQLEERVRSMFWRDPFSSEVVPVRKQDRDLLQDHAARIARGHGDAGDDELSRVRADLTAARAENARLRTELAQVQGEGSTSGGDADAQAECVAPSHHLRVGRPDGSGHSHRGGGYLEALNSSSPVHHRRSGAPKRTRQPSIPSAPAGPPAAPAEAVTGPPAGWHSSDPRGIIIVPIEAPVPIHADKPSARAH